MSDAEDTDADAVTDTETGPDEALLDVLRSADRSPLPTTAVAKLLDSTPEETRERLAALVEAGELERREVEHRTWWRLPGRSAEPSEEAIAAAEAEGRVVATGVDSAVGEESPPAGAPPETHESFRSGVEWTVDVEVDSRALAAFVFVVAIVLVVLWRRR